MCEVNTGAEDSEFNFARQCVSRVVNGHWPETVGSPQTQY
jgi:hypothetical protein